jgi:hypothetical protein
VVDYQECPFCDRIFEVPQIIKWTQKTPLEEHIEADHHKLKVRKGSNYKWMDKVQVERRLFVIDTSRKSRPSKPFVTFHRQPKAQKPGKARRRKA